MLNMKVNVIAYLLALVVTFFTRKVLLDQLGTEFIGLTTTMNSLLGFLNLAELGVGASIAYFLYKPIFADDRCAICDILSIMGYLYRYIGGIILGAGIICSCFLPSIFSQTDFPLGILFYCFYGQLFSSLLGYFVNYKANTIFSADQRQYLVSVYFQATQLLTAILQAVLAYYTRSLVLYVTVAVLLSVINSVIVNWKCYKVYPWIETSFSRGREALRQRPEIVTYVKRVFVHQVGGFVNRSAMPLVIYGSATLSTVTLYGNYSLLNNKIGDLIFSALRGTDASVGNLIAEGDQQKIYNCYKELFSIKFFVVTYLSLCLVQLNSDFITVWLGPQYVLPKLLVLLICADFWLNLLRNTTDQFINGYGLKADIWVPLCRIASLGVMIWTGQRWGMTGILWVPVLFQLIFTHLWKPYYLYHSGLQLPLRLYGKLVGSNALPFLLAYLICIGLSRLLNLDRGTSLNWMDFLYQAMLFCLPLLIVSALLSWLLCDGIRIFVCRFSQRRTSTPA